MLLTAQAQQPLEARRPDVGGQGLVSSSEPRTKFINFVSWIDSICHEAKTCMYMEAYL